MFGIKEEDIKNNLELITNRINENINTKYSYIDAIYENSNIIINIEVNRIKSKETLNKNTRYVCQLLLKQVPVGAKDKLKKVYQININDYDIFLKNEFIYKSTLLEEKYHLRRNDYLNIIDINMDFLRKKNYNEIEKENEKSLEKLLYIFICEDKSKR